MVVGEDRAVAATPADLPRERELTEGWAMLRGVQTDDLTKVWLQLRKSLEDAPMPDKSGRALPVTIYVARTKTYERIRELHGLCAQTPTI